MYALEHQVIEHEEGEQGCVQVQTWVGGGAEPLGVKSGGGQGVEPEQTGARKVQKHLRVDPLVEMLRILAPTEKQIGRQRPARWALRQHRNQAVGKAHQAGAGQGAPAVGVEPVPAGPAKPACREPGQNDHAEHQEAVQAVGERLARRGVDGVAVDPARGQGKMQDQDGKINRQRREPSGQQAAAHSLPSPGR